MPRRYPRRIATVSVHTSPLEQPGTGDAGGLNVYVVEVAKRLAERGVEVDIFTRAVSRDQPQVAELASGMLADEGYRVIIAGDGFEALKIYERIGKQIGLVILDFFLPVMDGDAVFDELLSINPTVDVVLSSGFAEQSKISSMLGQGLRGFIPKPYSREKLLEQVRSTLDAPRQAH